MTDGISVLVALFMLSAMLSTILTIAWATLGRATHARTWAVAFLIGTVQWACNLAYGMVDQKQWLFLLVNIFSVVGSALLALGFRQRAGLAEHRIGFVAGGLATIAILIASTHIIPADWLTQSVPHVFRAIALASSAAIVVREGRRPSAAERSVIIMLWLFALFCIAVATLAATSMLTGVYGDLEHWVLLLGMPTAYTGMGLFITFLLAADLAGRMRDLAARDPLTGVLNRRGFEEAANRAVANALRHRQPLSLAVADLDRFKAVNDLHGHATGDLLLRRFASAIDEAIRQGDLIGRIGGEEFVLLLVNTPADVAVAVIDRLRRDVATLTLATDPPLTVTTSFGVAQLTTADGSLDALIARADGALYRSKQGGRDRVTLAEQ